MLELRKQIGALELAAAFRFGPFRLYRTASRDVFASWHKRLKCGPPRQEHLRIYMVGDSRLKHCGAEQGHCTDPCQGDHRHAFDSAIGGGHPALFTRLDARKTPERYQPRCADMPRLSATLFYIRQKSGVEAATRPNLDGALRFFRCLQPFQRSYWISCQVSPLSAAE